MRSAFGNDASRLGRVQFEESAADRCSIPGCSDPAFHVLQDPICIGHASRIFADITAAMGSRRDPVLAAAQAELDAERADRRAAEECVYYVRMFTVIKIGTTTDLPSRIRALGVESDWVLATEPGSYELESRRHRQFADIRIGKREYFAPTPTLLDHVDSIRAKHGAPKVNRDQFDHYEYMASLPR